jgi:PAS domain-containing protein
LPAGDATVAESPRLARLAELLSHVDGPFMLTLDAPDGERTYLADLHEEGSDEDAPTSLILLLHDHTELIHLQKALRESENRLRAITGAAMEAIIAMDNKGAHPAVESGRRAHVRLDGQRGRRPQPACHAGRAGGARAL